MEISACFVTLSVLKCMHIYMEGLVLFHYFMNDISCAATCIIEICILYAIGERDMYRRTFNVLGSEAANNSSLMLLNVQQNLCIMLR